MRNNLIQIKESNRRACFTSYTHAHTHYPSNSSVVLRIVLVAYIVGAQEIFVELTNLVYI